MRCLVGLIKRACLSIWLKVNQITWSWWFSPTDACLDALLTRDMHISKVIVVRSLAAANNLHRRESFYVCITRNEVFVIWYVVVLVQQPLHGQMCLTTYMHAWYWRLFVLRLHSEHEKSQIKCSAIIAVVLAFQCLRRRSNARGLFTRIHLAIVLVYVCAEFMWRRWLH